jgi:hypothetical protein
MTPDPPNLARGGAAGSGDAVCFAGERRPDSTPPQNFQAQNLVRRFGVRPPLHLVPRPPPPRPRRIVIHISARDSRGVIGRTRALRLTEPDLARLIAIAERMEARRA